jgi:hypothetical protein
MTANYDMDKSAPTSDVIGVARTAGRDSSKTTGDLFSDIVKRKARARRAR